MIEILIDFFYHKYILDPENYLKNSLITQNYSEREDISKLRKEVDDTKYYLIRYCNSNSNSIIN